MRVLVLAENDWSGAGYALMQALNANGHQARAVVMNAGWYTRFPTDMIAPDAATLRRWLEWADVWNLHDNAHVLLPDGLAPKPTVVTYHGSAYRQNHAAWNALAQERGWVQTCLTQDLCRFGATWLGRPMHDLSHLRRPGDGFIVAHAPTNRQAKGTAEVIAALAGLDGVTLDLIENAGNRECLARKARAQVVIDQIGPQALGYGTNALETWALGLPVISWAPADVQQVIGDPPFYPAQDAEAVRRAVEALRDPVIRERWRDAGRRYLAEYHAPQVVADRFAALARQAGAQERPASIHVSVCMIVRNEEEMLEQAVNSARGLADEFVIVDTGSEDGTVRLAERLGAVTITGADRMHKGASRNTALDAARGQWCVVLDADETIADPLSVREYLETTKARAAYVTIQAGDISWAQMRMWRKGAFRYQYRAHEVPVPTTNWRGVEYTAHVWRHHQPGARWAWKLPYTLERLKLDVAENPGDGRPLYYLGRQYVYLNDWENGVTHLRRYLELAPDGIDAPEAHKHLAHCYGELGRKREQLAEMHLAIAAEPTQRDTWYELAQQYYGAENFTAALALLTGALQIPRNGHNYTHEEAYGPDIYDLTARCLWHLGRYEDGRLYAQEALALAPDDAHFQKNLWWFEHKLGLA